MQFASGSFKFCLLSGLLKVVKSLKVFTFESEMHSIEYLLCIWKILRRVQWLEAASAFGFLCKRNFFTTLIY